jgi:hypothetical protein
MSARPVLSRVALALVALVCGIMGFVLATAALPAQATTLAADGLLFLRESALAWLAMWIAVGAFRRTALIARVLGVISILLGAGVLTVALARLYAGSQPDATAIIGFGAIAFIAQVVTGVLTVRYRRIPMSAVALWRASRDGCAAHLIVMAAGIAVMVTESNVADVAVGGAIAAMFMLDGLMALIRGRLGSPFEADG